MDHGEAGTEGDVPCQPRGEETDRRIDDGELLVRLANRLSKKPGRSITLGVGLA
jgi:hypothetical protein